MSKGGGVVTVARTGIQPTFAPEVSHLVKWIARGEE